MKVNYNKENKTKKKTERILPTEMENDWWNF